MKLKTIISSMILAIILLFTSRVYAAETLSEMNYDQSSFEQSYNEGTAETTVGTKSVQPTDSLTNSITSVIIRLINPLPTIVSLLLSGFSYQNFDTYFTIQDLIFGEIEVFNVNFFAPSETVDTNKTIANRVSELFYAVRNIAIVANLAILIYVAIRMALATIGEEKAKYKKMLVDWFVGFVIITILPYVMAILMALSDELMNLLKKALENSPLGGIEKIENKILGDITNTKGSGFSIVIPSITYWILVFYQVKFFLMYIKRLLSIAFLTIISPLISVTYAMDKIGDGAAQAWSAWIKEFAINIFIQPLHAFLYLLFMVTTYNILDKAPLLAVIFLMALSRGERIIRNVFRIRNLESIRSMSDNYRFKDMGNFSK